MLEYGPGRGVLCKRRCWVLRARVGVFMSLGSCWLEYRVVGTVRPDLIGSGFVRVVKGR